MLETIRAFIEAIQLLMTIIERNETTGEYEVNLRVNIRDPEDHYIVFVTAEAPVEGDTGATDPGTTTP